MARRGGGRTTAERVRRRRRAGRIARRHLRSGKPLRSPTEDSRPLVSTPLKNRGWEYTSGKWHPPKLKFPPGTGIGTKRRKEPRHH